MNNIIAPILWFRFQALFPAISSNPLPPNAQHKRFRHETLRHSNFSFFIARFSGKFMNRGCVLQCQYLKILMIPPSLPIPRPRYKGLLQFRDSLKIIQLALLLV